VTLHVFGSLGTGLGEGDSKDVVAKLAEECGNVKQDLGTKTGREQAFKASAKCAADSLCALYSKGAIPPGVCSSIAGPLAESAVSVWNSVFADNEEAERARQRDINTMALFDELDRLRGADTAWLAYYSNTCTRLIQYHDKILPSQAGAWGGGKLETTDLSWYAFAAASKDVDSAGKWDPKKHTHYFKRQRYSNDCPVLVKLAAYGAPVAAHKLSLCPSKLSIPSLHEGLYIPWAAANSKAGAVTKTNEIKKLLSEVLPKWTESLDKAANKLRTEVLMQAVKLELDPPAASGSPVKTVAKVTAAAGAGWLAWKYLVPLLKVIN
jgi:hypothetical protein